MDRQIVYAGSIPLDTDLLNIQRNMQLAFGGLARLILGVTPVVDGFACYPSPDAYSVAVTPGTLTVLTQNDYSAFGALPADATLTMRTGSLAGNVELGLASPPEAGLVQPWLIQVRITEEDAGPVVLPYWNAANPSVPYSGPGNSGVPQATQRQMRVMLGAKAGGAQLPDAPVPPTPDPGWVGLFVVKTYFGKPGIEAGDISNYFDVPRLRYPLAALPPAATSQLVFTAHANWTVPDLVRWAKVRLVGGGGGGGGGDTTYSGGGGGAGGYAEAIVQVVPGQVIEITIGAGGAGGVSGASGSSGGGTFFGPNQVSASGGTGGGAGNPDSHGGSPGQGTYGSFLQGGGYGGDGAAAPLIPGGNGGAGMFGGGGRGADEGGVPAFGLAAGSGGGGGYGAQSDGGGGAAGVVVVEY